MGRFHIDSWFARHEGGTKFYRVFAIYDDGGNAACVTHWGALADADEDDLIPSKHGQTKIELCHARNILGLANDARRAKMKRGYTFDSPEKFEYSTKNALFSEVKRLMKDKDAATIILHLENMIEDGIDVTDETVEEKPKKAASKPEPVRGTEWGSW